MPTTRKLADFLGVSLFCAALGYFGAIAQFSTRQAVNDARLATLEKQSEKQSGKVDAIYAALVQRGVIRLPGSLSAAALKLPGGSSATAETETALEIMDSDWRRDRGGRARGGCGVPADRTSHSRARRGDRGSDRHRGRPPCAQRRAEQVA